MEYTREQLTAQIQAMQPMFDDVVLVDPSAGQKLDPVTLQPTGPAQEVPRLDERGRAWEPLFEDDDISLVLYWSVRPDGRPLVLAGTGYKEMNSRLQPLAQALGVSELLKKFPYEISGGQKQRVAVARAVITRPSLLLADEPTGALDSRSTDELLRLFEQLNASGQTILMVTHSVKAASRARRN